LLRFYMYADKIPFPELLEFLLKQTSICKNIFLVGGCMRDMLLGQSTTDLDFVVSQAAPQIGKITADAFQGAFYVLDRERNIARTIIEREKHRFVLDFAKMRGASIEEDLIARDFTINALAVDLAEPTQLIDPLKGLQDLQDKVLRPCREDSFLQDPVRTLRAIRFIDTYQLQYNDDTVERIRRSARDITNSSFERIRDELFTIFDQTDIKASLFLLREFGLFDVLFPEIAGLSAIYPGVPHQWDVLTHTFRVMEWIQVLLNALEENDYSGENRWIGMALRELRPYRSILLTEVKDLLNPLRSKLGLLYLAALYHDSGKAMEKNIPLKDGQTARSKHADLGAEFFKTVYNKFALSNVEIDFVQRIIRCHMREELKTAGQDLNAGMPIYLFFREAGRAGILVIILHLADLLATYEQKLTQERWETALRAAVRLLDGWINKQQQWVHPPPLINGDDLIASCQLEPGKQIGEILESIRQAQVLGEIVDRKGALEWAINYVSGGQHG